MGNGPDSPDDNPDVEDSSSDSRETPSESSEDLDGESATLGDRGDPNSATDSAESDEVEFEQRITEQIIEEEQSVDPDFDEGSRNEGSGVDVRGGGEFTSRPANGHDMAFVEVKDVDIGEFDRELVPPFTGRHRDLVIALNDFVDQDDYTVSLLDIAHAVDPDWDHNNLREYLSDVEDIGAINKVLALDNNSREPVQIQDVLARHLYQERIDFEEEIEAKRILNYQWSAFHQARDPSSNVGDDAHDSWKAWLYSFVRQFMEPPYRTLNPKVHVNIRQLGRPDFDDQAWQADFKFSDALFPDQDFYDHIDQYAILVDIHYEDLSVARPGLEDRLEEELVNYHAASLHENEVAIGGVDAGDPETFIREKADPDTPDEHAPPVAHVPWFDYDASIDEQAQRIRLQSMYKQESDG